MLSLVRDNFVFYLLFIPLFIGSSFAISIAPLGIGVLGILWFIVKGRYDYVILSFLLTLILANNQSPVFISYENLRIVFVAVLFFLSGLIIFKEKKIDTRVMYFLPFFGVALISSIFFSPTLANSVFRVFSYLILVISIFILAKFLLEEQQYKFYDHLILLIAVVLLISFAGGFLYPTVFSISGRFNGVLGNPNFLGLFCILSYAFVDHFKIDQSSFSNNGILFVKGLIILCLLFSGSRNSYISFAIYLMLTIFLYRGFSGKSIAIMLGLGAVIVFFQIEELTRLFPFIREFVRPETIATASGRSIVWPVAIDEIARQPWLGGGFEYYSHYMITFARNHGLQGVFWYGVWNTYLAFLLDTGFIGLAAYFFFIYGVIRKGSGFILVFPFLAMMMFTGMFEAWAVSSLNPITPFFLLFFVVISTHGSRYENLSTA